MIFQSHANPSFTLNPEILNKARIDCDGKVLVRSCTTVIIRNKPACLKFFDPENRENCRRTPSLSPYNFLNNNAPPPLIYSPKTAFPKIVL